MLLVDAGDNVGQLRLLHVEPWARGLGIGGALVGRMRRLRARRRLRRDAPVDPHRARPRARRIYEAAGFRIVATEVHHEFGKPVQGETWELGLSEPCRTCYICSMKMARPGRWPADRRSARAEARFADRRHAAFRQSRARPVNIRVPDVLGPGHSARSRRIVDRLAAFRPTRVAVEWPADAQAELDQRYADYRAGRRALSANERDQIGLRLAARARPGAGRCGRLERRSARTQIRLGYPGQGQGARARRGMAPWVGRFRGRPMRTPG